MVWVFIRQWGSVCRPWVGILVAYAWRMEASGEGAMEEDVFHIVERLWVSVFAKAALSI